MKRYQVIITLILCMLLLLCGCANTVRLSDGAPMTVYVRITGYDNEIILPETEIGLYENETVLDVLVRAAKENDIRLDYSGTGMTAYVKGIANLYEFDYGPQSGWVYYVSGYDSLPSTSCGAYTLSDQDTVEWVYVTERAE